MSKEATSLTILDMPKWKSKILDTVAWILGMRGEHVACITFNFDYTDPKIVNKLRENNGTSN